MAERVPKDFWLQDMDNSGRSEGDMNHVRGQLGMSGPVKGGGADEEQRGVLKEQLEKSWKPLTLQSLEQGSCPVFWDKLCIWWLFGILIVMYVHVG